MNSELPKNSGYWVTGCYVHTMVDHSKWHAEATVEGMEMRYAIYGWYSDTFLKKRNGKWKFLDDAWKDGTEPEKCKEDGRR